MNHELHWQTADLDDITVMDTEEKCGDCVAASSSTVVTKAKSTTALTSRGNSVPLSSIHSVSALQITSSEHAPTSALGLPFVFVVEGASGHSTSAHTWKLVLQAPSAWELNAWTSYLKRHILSVWSSIPDPSMAVFQAIRSGDVAASVEVLSAYATHVISRPSAKLLLSDGIRGRSEYAPRDGSGNTPLLAAAAGAGSHYDVFKALLRLTRVDHGDASTASVVGRLDDVNLDGKSALHLAVETGSLR